MSQHFQLHPKLNIRVGNRWVNIDIKQACERVIAEQTDPYNGNGNAIVALSAEFDRMASTPELARAYSFYNGQLYFLNSLYKNPKTHAVYVSEECSIQYNNSYLPFNQGACVFFASYPTYAAQYGEGWLRNYMNTGKNFQFNSSVLAHEVSHWLDHSIYEYGWVRLDIGGPREGSLKTSSPYKHTDTAIYRLLSATEKRLSCYQSIYGVYHRCYLKQDHYKRHQFNKESFAEFSANYYGGGSRDLSPIIGLYFEKILNYQLNIMSAQISEEEKYLRLTALGEILNYRIEKLIGTAIQPDEYRFLRQSLLDAHFETGPSKAKSFTQARQQIYDKAQQILSQVLNRLIDLVEAKAQELINSNKSEDVFSFYCLPEALKIDPGIAASGVEH